MAETYTVQVGSVTLTAATAKTMVEIAAPSTQSFRMIAVSVWFDGSVSGTSNAKVEIVRYATTGTGTAYTPLRANGEAQNKAALCTAKVSDTVEPGTPTVVKTWSVPLSSGMIVQWPLGRELYATVSTLMGIRVTAPVAAICSVDIEFEE